MSFLKRTIGGNNSISSDVDKIAISKVSQLHVDVFQTGREMVIYAQTAGADLDNIHVSIEGEANIVLIEGRRIRPESLISPKKGGGSFVAEECIWGDFYRRIILPERVDLEQAEAKIKNGILILNLPLLKLNEKKISRYQMADERAIINSSMKME